MKFTRTSYPDFAGGQGSPCWQLKGRWLDIDADWNTNPPFGVSFSLHIGKQPPSGMHNLTPGFLLEVNPPEGEPNRLYLWLSRWHVTFGLPSVRGFRETGREGNVVHGEYFSNWLHPHIDGISRYRYHQDETGQWVRNAEPDPLHWGWLTIERRRNEYE